MGVGGRGDDPLRQKGLGGKTIVQFPVKISNSGNNLNSNLISPGH